MTSVVVSGLHKHYEEFHAVKGIDFVVNEGEIVSLLGPSGCGKTTTLRSIAGLERPSEGSIQVGERTVFDSAKSLTVPAERRNLGLVFQSYALWPHKTVYENVVYGLKMKGVKSGDARGRVGEILSLVGLTGLENRFPGMLSGGQQQRVSLARSLVVDPAVLLLDEPLSNLDLKLRDTMRGELRSIIKSAGYAAVFVTHDQHEAMAISDRIILMQDGEIIQEGSPREVYEAPASIDAAKFFGQINLFEGRQSASDTVDVGAHSLRVSPSALFASRGSASAASTYVAIRPEKILLRSDPNGITVENIFESKVLQSTYLGSHSTCTIELPFGQVKVEGPDQGLRPGDVTWAVLPAEAIHVLTA